MRINTVKKIQSSIRTDMKLDKRAIWSDGMLLIDGTDAKNIVSHAETMGWIRRGAEVFARDSKPVWVNPK